jgi:hypothetical protein
MLVLYFYMHCSIDLHSQLISLVLIICYSLIPWFTYSGTSYKPLASPIPQLSILLLLDYGWDSGLGLRCGKSRCVSCVHSGCVSPWCVLAGASRLVTDEHLPRKDAIWPRTRGTCRMGWRWGVLVLGPLRTDRQLTLLQMTFTVQTARLVMGGGAGWDL